MRLAQIRDVNIVAYSSSVLGWIVVAKNRDARNSTLRSKEYKRYQMRLGIMMLTAFFGRSGCIEITKRDKFKAICQVISLECAFDHHLAPTVWIDGELPMFFVDRRILRIPIGCAGRGENKLIYALFHQDIEHSQCLCKVVFKILARILDRFANISECREVHASMNVII